jgi:hypothetical protein
MAPPVRLAVLTAAALLLAAVSGCERRGGPLRGALDMPGPPVTARPAPAAAPAPRIATPYAGGPLRVTESGAGPISAGAAFSAEAIAALFPEAEVTTRTAPAGYSIAPVVLVRQAGLGLRIEADADGAAIGRVLVWGDNAVGPNGERLQDRGGPKSFSPEQCRIPPHTTLLTAVCRRTPDSHVALTYTVGDFAPPRTAASDFDELVAHGFLAYIAWERTPPV